MIPGQLVWLLLQPYAGDRDLFVFSAVDGEKITVLRIVDRFSMSVLEKDLRPLEVERASDAVRWPH
jgi:hypothetical protein